MSRHTAPYSFVMMRLMLVLLGAWTLSVQGLYIKTGLCSKPEVGEYFHAAIGRLRFGI